MKNSLKTFYSFFDQYLNYKKQFVIAETEGLQDRKKLGGNTKLSMEAERVFRGRIKTRPDVTLEWLQDSIQEDVSCKLSLSAISRALKRICGDQESLSKGRPRWTAHSRYLRNLSLIV